MLRYLKTRYSKDTDDSGQAGMTAEWIYGRTLQSHELDFAVRIALCAINIFGPYTTLILMGSEEAIYRSCPSLHFL